MKKLIILITILVLFSGCDVINKPKNNNTEEEKLIEIYKDRDWKLDDKTELNPIIKDLYESKVGRSIEDFREYYSLNEYAILFSQIDVLHVNDVLGDTLVNMYIVKLAKNRDGMPNQTKPLKYTLPAKDLRNFYDNLEIYINKKSDKFWEIKNDKDPLDRYYFILLEPNIFGEKNMGYEIGKLTYANLDFSILENSFEWINYDMGQNGGFDTSWIRNDEYYKDFYQKKYNTDINNPFYDYFNLNERIELNGLEWQVYNVNKFRILGKQRYATLEELSQYSERMKNAYNNLKNNKDFTDYKESIREEREIEYLGQ